MLLTCIFCQWVSDYACPVAWYPAKDAFRKFAMRDHPDRGKSPDTEVRFREIAEAYAVLSNPKKRAEYDARGHARVTGRRDAAGRSIADQGKGLGRICNRRPRGSLHHHQRTYSGGTFPERSENYTDSCVT